jgi:alpha-glucosidase
MNRPEVHEIYRDWRGIADASDPPRVLVGETWIFDLREVARFYGETGDELNLCFNFPFVFADLDAEILRGIVEATEDALEPFAQPAWAGSNHDVGRFPTRWCADRPDAARCALLMVLTLRGTPFLYFGDEIGMVEVPVPRDDVRDPAGELGTQPGRDPGRTPMQWNAGPGAGFTREGVRPWLPIGDARANNVEDQRRDPGSVLRLCRDLIALRRETSDLRSGAYASLPSPPGAWSWRRGPSTIIAVNLSDWRVAVPVGPGTIAIGTDRSRDGETADGDLSLGPWEGAVLRVAPA